MKKGFTLIELLIVIGILGILAAGLLAAIDPLDQLRRARDQSKRNTSIEVSNALGRFYASRGVMPWGTGLFGPISVTSVSGMQLISTLITGNELKSTFLNGVPTSGNPIYIYSDVNTSIYGCVQQEAHAQNENAIYLDNLGTTGTDCIDGLGTTGCWYCAR